MPKRRTAAKAPRKRCEAAQIGRTLKALYEAFNEADAAADKDCDCMTEITDLIDAAEARLATVQATSLEGVMAQLGLIHTEAACIHSFVDGTEHDRIAGPQFRRLRRMLHSAVTALEAISGTPRAEVGGGHYLPAKIDPRQSVRRAA